MRAMVAAAIGALTAVGIAAEVPVTGTKLLLKDSAGPTRRSARFVAKKAVNLDVGTLASPAVVGATLEFSGNEDDGHAGPLDLPATNWSGLGSPPGARG